MRIISRNVNGLRAVLKKGLLDQLEKYTPDILCIQETKAFAHQCPETLSTFLLQHGYQQLRHQGQKPGYAGTAIFYQSELNPTSVQSFWESYPVFHTDGRMTQIDIGNTVIINCYFPNGGTRADGTEMLSAKLSFYDDILHYTDNLLAQDKHIVLVGDCNICHKPIDIARPEANKNSIGFLPVERAKLDELFAHGYVDVFRHFYPDQKDAYTRRSYRAGARQRNVGRRLDYAIVDQEYLDSVQSMRHLTEVWGSDHCPIELVLDLT